MKLISRNTPNSLMAMGNMLGGFAEEKKQSNLRQEVDEAGQFAMQKVAELGEKAMTPEGVQEIARSMSERGFRPQAAMIGVKAAMEYTRMFAEAQSRQQQNTLFGQQQEQYGRQTARENQSLEAEDILNRISLMGQGANTGLMPQTGEGVGLSSMGVPANEAARMGQTQKGLLDTLIENPIAGKGYTNMQAQQAQSVQDAEKTAADLAYKKAQTDKLNFDMNAPKQTRTMSMGDSENVEQRVLKEVARDYGVDIFDGTLTGKDGQPLPQEETEEIQSDAEALYSITVQEVRGGTNPVEAVRVAKRKFKQQQTQNVDAAAQQAMGLAQTNPEAFQRGMARLKQEAPRFAQMVRDRVAEMTAGSTQSEPESVAEQVGGQVNPSGNVVFRPANETELKSKLMEIEQLGLIEKTKQYPDGSVVIHISEDPKKPKDQNTYDWAQGDEARILNKGKQILGKGMNILQDSGKNQVPNRNQ